MRSAQIACFSLLIGGILTAQDLRVVPGRSSVRPDDTVDVRFSAYDQWGQPVMTLTRDEILVTDNGVSVEDFSVAYDVDAEFTMQYLVLLLDVSGSMRAADRMERLRATARSCIAALGPNDVCSIVRFSTEAEVVCGFTKDTSLLAGSVRGLRPGGQTALYDGVFASLSQLDPAPSSAVKTVVIVSDGREEGNSLFSMTEIAPKLVTLNNLRIHAVDLNDGSPATELQRLTRITGGIHWYPSGQDSIFDAGASFLNRSNSTYRVSFKNRDADRAGVNIVSMTVGTGEGRTVFTSAYEQPVRTREAEPLREAWVYLGGVAALGLVLAAVLFQRRRRRDSVPLTFTSQPWSQDWKPPGGANRDDDEHTRTLDPLSLDGERTMILTRDDEVSPSYGELVLQESGSGPQKRFFLDSPEILIGRSLQCGVRFSEHDVSRLHAKIRREGENLILFDLGSANGTYVNGEEIQQRPLRNGDVIEVGSHKLAFHADERVTA